MSSNNNMDREIIDPCQAKVNNFNILLQEYNSIERYFTLPLRDLHTNVPIFVRMPFYENVYPYFRFRRKFLLLQLRLDGIGRLNLFLRLFVV